MRRTPTWPLSILASFPVDTSCRVPPQCLAGEHNKPKLSGAFARCAGGDYRGYYALNGTRRACLVHVSTQRNLNTACLHCLFIVSLFLLHNNNGRNESGVQTVRYVSLAFLAALLKRSWEESRRLLVGGRGLREVSAPCRPRLPPEDTNNAF